MIRYEGKHKLTKKDGDIGFDLRALGDDILRPGETKVVHTGTKIAFEGDVYAWVMGRSGLSSRGISCQLGLVDTGYRGDIGVMLTNLSGEDFHIREGDRIGQLVFMREEHVMFEHVDRIDSDTDRGAKGFGSSGRR